MLTALLAPLETLALAGALGWAAAAELEWRYPLLAAELRRRHAGEELLTEVPTKALLARLRAGRGNVAAGIYASAANAVAGGGRGSKGEAPAGAPATEAEATHQAQQNWKRQRGRCCSAAHC